MTTWWVDAERIAMAEVSINEIGVDQTWKPDEKKIAVVLDPETAAYAFGSQSEDTLPKGKHLWDPLHADKWATGNTRNMHDLVNSTVVGTVVSGPQQEDQYILSPASQAHALAKRLNDYARRPSDDQIAEIGVPNIESDASLYVTIFRYVTDGRTRILVDESEAQELAERLNAASRQESIA